MPEMIVRWVGGWLGRAPGTSSTTLPAEGTRPSRSPSGVQVSRRAAGTSAHASAVQPRGRVTVCAPLKAPWRLAAGTLTVTRVVAPVAVAVAPGVAVAVVVARLVLAALEDVAAAAL